VPLDECEKRRQRRELLAVPRLHVLDLAKSTGDVPYLAELHRLEGALHAEDDPRAAEDSFRRAIAVAREQGARSLELRATTSLARLSLRPGTRAATRRTIADDLAELVAWFSDATENPDLRDARQVLSRRCAATARNSPARRRRTPARHGDRTSSRFARASA